MSDSNEDKPVLGRKPLGIKRTVMALTLTAFILGIPVFFEVGFIIVIPLIYGFAKVATGWLKLIVLPIKP